MPDEIKKEAAAVESKAAEAIESAEDVAKKEAAKAEEEANKIAKKDGEEAAQKWLDQKLAGIETNLGTKLAAIQTWFQEEMGKFQQKLFEQTKEQLATSKKEKESSTPENSTPAQTPENQAEKNGSQRETSGDGNRKSAKKRRRI